MHFWQTLLLVLSVLSRSKGITHWVVTQNGKIETKLDTPFRLTRYHDLITLLDQEQRHKEITALYQDLLERTKQIDLKTSSLVGPAEVEGRVFSQNPECQQSGGKRLEGLDFYAFIAAANGTGPNGLEFQLYGEKAANERPDCRKFVPLNFSMFAYEHMPSMVKRKEFKVPSSQDKENLKRLMPVETLEEFSDEIIAGLKKNSSSWLHYNWGTLYWWMKGDGHMALECARRALFYVPRAYKHIPLLNLGGLLHQGRAGREAVLLLHATLDHIDGRVESAAITETCGPVLFALANAYATLADFNTSATYLDSYLRMRPDDQVARVFRLTMLCYLSVEEQLQSLLVSLQDLLTNLHEYHGQQQHWLRLQERSSWEQAPNGFGLNTLLPQAHHLLLSDAQLVNVAQRCARNTDGTASSATGGISCEFVEKSSEVLYKNDFYLGQLLQLAEEQMQMIERTLLNSATFGGRVKEVDGKKRREWDVADAGLYKDTDPDIILEHLHIEDITVNTHDAKPNTKQDDTSKSTKTMPEQLRELYPTTGGASSSGSNLYFDSTDWPSNEDCDAWNLPLDDQEDLDLPVFMPPENKGYQVGQMLSDFIDIPKGIEHPLPWHPPHCEYSYKDEATAKLLHAHDQRNKLSQARPHPKIAEFLRNYSGIDTSGEDILGDNAHAEIGQRIVSALKKKTGPAYVLKTVASLYWRSKENAMNALSCLNAEIGDANEHQDILLVSIGSLLHHLGYTDKALQYAKAAFKINFAEPSTNFLLALLHYQKNNPILAKHYMRNVLRVDSTYYGGVAEHLLHLWACRVKLGRYKDRVEEDVDDDSSSSKKHQERSGRSGRKKDWSESNNMCSSDVRKDESGACRVQDLSDCVIIDNGCKINGKPVAKIITTSKAQHCRQKGITLRKSILSNLLHQLDQADDNTEPDQSQLETVSYTHEASYLMKISRDLFSIESKNLGDFYISASISEDEDAEETFHIFDKSGSYPLSHKGCKEIQDMDWMQFSSMWQSIANRNFNVGDYLKPLSAKVPSPFKPHCSRDLPPSEGTLDHLTSMVLRHRLPSDVPENYLSEWLALITGDHESSMTEIGTKLSLALHENTTSWMLATAAALYWRVVGNTEEAVACLRQALTFVPGDMRDIPLISLANVLNRVGFHADALEVTYIALDSHPQYVVNYFTAGNIYDSVGDIDNAVLFYRASLNIDANFEPARNRLQAILCSLLFDDSDLI